MRRATPLMKALGNYRMKKYSTPDEVFQRAKNLIKNNIVKYDSVEHYKTMFSLIDYTTLDVTDTNKKVEKMVHYVNGFKEIKPDIPNVAAICVYPPFVSTIKKHLTASNVNIASVAGSFPSSQTTLEVKLIEVQHCLNNGADEIDIVLPVGKFIEEQFEDIFKEISIVKSLCGERRLKVILEVDALKDCNAIYNASFLAMDAGADFIKTSTGKIDRDKDKFEGRLLVMCDAINDFNAKIQSYMNDYKVAIKPAGGIKTAEHALQIYTLISEVLRKEYQNSKLFRIGASSLTDSILSKIKSLS